MKLKKGILLTALTLILVSIIGAFTNVQASSDVIKLNIRPLRDSKYGYKVVNNSEKYIWQIYATDDKNETFYCIKGGPGFGSAEGSNEMEPTITPVDYKVFKDMRNGSNVASGALSNYIDTLPGSDRAKKLKNYERLMWVLSQCYIAPKDNVAGEVELAQTNKQNLLNAVERYAERYSGVFDFDRAHHSKLTDFLTDYDIDAIQQLAVWYYTNDATKDNEKDYHVEGNPTIKINATEGNDGNYVALNNDSYDRSRQHAMDALFGYLTETPSPEDFSYNYLVTGNTDNPVVLNKTLNPSISQSGERLIVGPYKIEVATGGNLSLEGTFTDGNSQRITDIKFLDNNKNSVAEGTTLEDLANKNFYISIPNTTNASNIKFSISGSYYTTKVTYLSVLSPTSKDQPIVQLGRSSKTITDSVDVQITGNYQVQLEKVDSSNSNTKLSGAEFSYQLPGEAQKTGSTDSNGILNLGTVQITGINSADNITITETNAPAGYKKLIDSLNVQVTKGISSGNYVATGASITSGEVEGASATLSGNVIKITVPNEKITGSYQVQLEKVDSNDANVKLSGAEFSYTLPGGVPKTGTTNESGILNLGTVQITNPDSTDTITITETNAPTGYRKLIDSLTVQINKGVSGENYVATGVTITSGEVEGVSATLSGNVIKIMVPNEKKAGSYQLQLEKVDSNDANVKLPGAQFSYTLPGESQKTGTTDANGILSLGTVEITNPDSTDTITITETNAPTGYNKLIGSLTLQVSKGTLDGGYVATGASITSGGVEGTSVTVNENVIKIKVPNERITGNYQLQLEKVDSNDTNVKLPGAQFSYQLPGEAQKTGTTDSNGILNLGTVEITDVSGKDNITITETNAPIGYNKLIDSINVQVTKGISGGNYVVADATITSGGVEGTSVTVNGNVIKVTVPNEKITGNYQLQLEKVDSNNANTKLAGAKFSYRLPGVAEAKTGTTDSNGILNLGTVEITDANSKDNITVTETNAPTGYKKLIDSLNVQITKGISGGNYVVTGATITSGGVEGTNVTINGNVIKITVPNRKSIMDLALRKFITSVEGKELTGENSREPKISEETLKNLANGNILTTEKVHTKEPVAVQEGYKVIYTIRVYNEGEIDGWATEVTDYLPNGLKFLPESEVNKKYGWSNPSGDGKTIVTSYLASEEYKLTAFNKETLKLDYQDLQIECEVVARVSESDQTLENIAEITGNKDINGNTDPDIDQDSNPGNVTSDPNKYEPKDPTKGMGEQDDDDFEKLILPGKYFDLSLRKFITAVTDLNNNPRNVASREPVVDTSTLLKGEKTAIYNHTKTPVGVSNGDIVTYTIRVYNEGQLDGYVTEITDHLPKQLEFIVDDELNAKYGWKVSEDGRTVTTDITSTKTSNSANRDTIYAKRKSGSDKVLLEKFAYTKDAKLDYIDVQIRCKVKDNIDLFEKITNIADITEFTDNKGNEIKDRDSQEKNVTLPTDEKLPVYKDTEIERGDKYIPGQQDDDDFEKLVIQKFDLSLRKFITEVKNQDGSNVQTITNRVPVFKVVDGKYTYEHTKEPVEVANTNIVTYTLRIFNEGNVAGYATEIKDDIPEGLEFLPNDSTNVAFRWKMYKEDGTETKNVKEASYIKTDFLSKENEKKDAENLLKPFNPKNMTQPDYKDIKVAFKVTEPNTSDRIVINKAQISEDSDKDGNQIDDVDSIPDKWNEGEDDQDIEKVKVKYFDLSLKKWVTESIVTYNGKTTVTKSGHTGNENPEAPMKVEIQAGKINNTTVKFRFNIKVTNEGEIAGYATELIDYIPEGLKFVQKDNPKWEQVDGKVVTDQLKDKLLNPGESATVDIVLTWINGKDNMGEKVNWAEINKDKNEYNSPDIDSTPGNNKKGEDDIDNAPVLLTPATGRVQTYITLTLACVMITASGVFLIKKFVI